MREHGLAVGADVPVEFGETHTQPGTGKVKRINPCPPLRAGPGKIVTGLFRHATPEIFTVSTADGERLNATAEHPFWSEDRQLFVPVKDLQPGERLRHLTGETSVVSIHSRPARETVYNLEVHGSHVGQAGLLVHNCDVYRSLNAAGKTQYVGITNNLARRAAEHLRKTGIEIDPLMKNLSRSDAKAVEQALIEIHKLGKNGGTLMNKINSISKTNPEYADQLARGFELLKTVGYE